MIKITSIKILFILLITCTQFFSQIKIHQKFSTENGLVNDQIVRIFQDSKGYVWFATFGGVSRWDGINFTNFTKNNGLISAQVMDVDEGKDGTIYFATFIGGIQTYKNGVLDTLNESDGYPMQYTSEIFVAEDSTVYFMGGGNIVSYKNGEFADFGHKLNIPQVANSYFMQASNGYFYYGTWEGLYEVNNDGYKIYTENDGLNNQHITFIKENSNGEIILGSENGINKLSNGKITKLEIGNNGFPVTIFDIKISKDGRIYYASSIGLVIEDGNNLEYIKTENGLAYKTVWSLLIDNNENLIIGTNGYGFNLFSPDKIENNLESNFFNDLSVNSIYESKADVFVGTNNGLFRKSKYSNEFKQVKGLSHSIITAICGNLEGDIFIGTEGGLDILSKNKISTIFLNDNRRFPNRINSLDFGRNDELFIGTSTGLHIYNNNSFNRISKASGLQNDFISVVKVLQDSSIFIGYHGKGFSIWKNNQFFHFSESEGLSDGVVNCVYESKDGELFVGTDQGGLNIVNDNRLTYTINTSYSLTTNTIKNIISDNSDYIYLSTSNGLNILTFHAGEPFIRTINKTDGLASNNINTSSVDEEGNIWFGTSEGISIYNPIADKPVTNPPKIYLTGLEIFNESYPIELLNSAKGLNYNQNYLKFIYTGINLSAPDKILYKYRLSGVDQNWVESNNNNVQYTSLDDGNYTFEVKASNEWGYWSDPISLSFVINPAWWETWWFRLAIISALGFLLWLAFQYRLNYLLKLERLRTKIASDLHDEVGSLLTQISVNADSLSYTRDEDKRKEKSSFIRAKSSEVINMMSDVIWSIDSRNDNLDSLIDRIHNFAQNFLDQKNISLNFSTNIKNLQKPLKIDFRQNVMLIAKEAINNAVKYSNCSQIDVFINYNNDLFEMTISDNGKGFDLENVNKGNGLKNMKMRSDAIGAKIEFNNDNGFSIKLAKTKL